MHFDESEILWNGYKTENFGRPWCQWCTLFLFTFSMNEQLQFKSLGPAKSQLCPFVKLKEFWIQNQPITGSRRSKRNRKWRGRSWRPSSRRRSLRPTTTTLTSKTTTTGSRKSRRRRQTRFRSRKNPGKKKFWRLRKRFLFFKINFIRWRHHLPPSISCL